RPLQWETVHSGDGARGNSCGPRRSRAPATTRPVPPGGRHRLASSHTDPQRSWGTWRSPADGPTRLPRRDRPAAGSASTAWEYAAVRWDYPLRSGVPGVRYRASAEPDPWAASWPRGIRARLTRSEERRVGEGG